MDFNNYAKAVGNNIRQARYRLGLTQQQVAEKGFSFRYYQELERGTRNPTLQLLLQLAQVLEVTVAELVEVEPGEKLRTRTPLAEIEVKPPKRGRKRKR